MKKQPNLTGGDIRKSLLQNGFINPSKESNSQSSRRVGNQAASVSYREFLPSLTSLFPNEMQVVQEFFF